jgi:protein TonB
VEPDGRVGAVRVIRAIDPGLDQKAIEAVRQWRFKPGSREGRAVPVLVNIELTFKIK